MRVPLRWSDMDAYGHVNNVQYLRLLEDARIMAFQDWFGARNSLRSSGCLVARSEIEYLAPLSFQHEGVAIDLWVPRRGGASFDLGYEIRDPDAPRDVPIGGTAAVADQDAQERDPQGRDQRRGRRIYAHAVTTLVWYDFAAGAPRRATDQEIAVLDGVRGPQVPMRRRGTR